MKLAFVLPTCFSDLFFDLDMKGLKKRIKKT